MKLIPSSLRARLVSLRERTTEDHGAMAVLVILMIPVLLLFTMIAVDVSRWYVELQRLQRAADSAALAGAPFMPDTLGASSNAVAAAQAAGTRNGVPIAASDIQQGGRVSQLRVTARGSVTNSFARMIGINTTNLSRSAVAEFTGPAPMGSPCNTFGNEPPGTTGAPPAASQLGTPTLSNCSTRPQFWAKIQGPNTEKVQGDRYMTRVCGPRGGTPALPDGCPTTTNNTEFRSEGYFFLLRVGAAAAGHSVQVQVYDPAWVQTGTQCESLADASAYPTNMNTYSPGTDGRSRYDNAANEFCTGDYDPSSGSPPRGVGRVDTTFLVREPHESLNPLNAPVISNCTSQFRGFATRPTRNQLEESNAAYDADLARVFHQWVTLCTINNARVGDYYIQVRTNRKLPDSGTKDVWLASDGDGAGSSVSPASNADDTTAVGRGSNSFAMRAFVQGNLNASRGLSVAGQDRMPIFMNATAGNATFNLIRVTPGSAGQSIKFAVYDVGDAASSGTVTVLPPIEANDAAPNPYAAGFSRGTGTFSTVMVASRCSSAIVNVGTNLPNCSVGISNTVNNGRVQEINVPVPSNYTCNVTDGGGCWFRLNVRFGSGNVNDITTWTASLDGDPVRLEE